MEGGGQAGQEAGDRMEALAACCLPGLGRALSKGGARVERRGRSRGGEAQRAWGECGPGALTFECPRAGNR